ncbi:uncharacterized protein LOC144877086 [Branchiostoma floridae x Branchiostoma japonicum]
MASTSHDRLYDHTIDYSSPIKEYMNPETDDFSSSSEEDDEREASFESVHGFYSILGDEIIDVTGRVWDPAAWLSSQASDRKIKKHTRMGKQKKKALDPVSVGVAMATDCKCGKRCLQKVEREAVEECRKLFWTMNRNKQSEFMRMSFMSADQTKEPNQKFSFNACGRSMCAVAWRIIYHISNGRYYRHLESYKKGWEMVTDLRQGNKYATKRWIEARVWLETTAARIGDRMPDRDKIHLPPCLTRQDVWQLYTEENSSRRPLGHTQFYKMWDTDLSNIKIPDVTDNFAKCTTCVRLKEHIMKTKSKKKREEFKLARKEHLLKQKNERAKYYKHIKKAQEKPQRYTSIILDGMDQKKTAIPHYPEKTKDDGQNQLGTHVTGAIVHGQHKAYAALDLNNIPHDANLTITVLMKILQDVAKANGGRLPPVLYLQLDNCYRENKNCYILAFCSELVRRKIVKKVKLSFLMVGHTHEDVDQFFSRISTTLQKSEATTLPELQALIESSYTPQPEAFEVSHVGDYKEWLSDELETISGHSVPHCFKFILEQDTNQSTILYKDYSTDRQWKKTTGTTAILLRASPTQPLQFVTPGPIKRLEEVKDSVTKAREMARLTAGQHSWWLDLFTNLEEYVPPKERANPLSGFQPFVIPEDEEEEDEEAEARREALARLLARENRQSEVRLARKRRGTSTPTTTKRGKKQRYTKN